MKSAAKNRTINRVTNRPKDQNPRPQKRSRRGEKLDPHKEKWLRWGEAAAGLRAAIAIRPAPGKPKRADFPQRTLSGRPKCVGAPIPG